MVAGDVAAVGANVDGIQEGMRITVNPEAPCGRCFTRHFEPVHCLNLKTLRPGGLAEYVCLSSELVPASSSYRRTSGMRRSLYGDTRLRDPGDLEIGDHDRRPRGHPWLRWCRTHLRPACEVAGATKIIVADLFDASLESAHALGATRTVNVERETLADVVREETAGYGADVVIEAVGSGPTYPAGI